LSALAPPPREDDESGAIAVRTAPSETIEELEMTELSVDSVANESGFELVSEPDEASEADEDTQSAIEAAAVLDENDPDTVLEAPAAAPDASDAVAEPESAAEPESSVADSESVAEAAAPLDESERTVTADVTLPQESTPMDLNAPAYAASAEQAGEAAAEGSEASEPAADGDDAEDRDEPTRVVAYRSVASGELDAAKTEADVTAQAPASTLPGMGAVEWDDEDMSTHLYDGPSAGALEAQTAQAVQAGATPSVAGTMSKPPSIAPFSSRPSLPVTAPRSVPPAASGSLPPVASLHPSVAPARGALPNRPWLLPALIATVGLAVLGGMWLFQGPNIGTIQLTTQPPDARVTFDGSAVQGNLSPFVIANVTSGEQHSLEVAREGYRTWSSRLTVAPGQTLQLPEVVLVAETTTAQEAASAPVVASPQAPSEAPRAPARSANDGASKPQERAPSGSRPAPRASAASAPRPQAATTAPRPQAPATAARPTAAAPAPAPAPRPATVAAPAPVAQGDSGMLRINTRPWSQVHVDGRLIGNTPQMSLRLSPGKHTVLLVNPEFGMRKTLTVTIKRGAVTTKIVDLSKP
jgi:hypothetical protein